MDYSWAKVWVKLLDNRLLRRIRDEQQRTATKWCWVTLILEARRCSANGQLLDKDGPLLTADLAVSADVSEEVMSFALSRFEEWGWVEDLNGILRVRNFDEHQETPDAKRMRTRREREREQAANMFANSSSDVRADADADADADAEIRGRFLPSVGEEQPRVREEGVLLDLPDLDIEPGPPKKLSKKKAPAVENEESPVTSSLQSRLGVTDEQLLELYQHWALAVGHTMVMKKLPREKYEGKTFKRLVLDLLDQGMPLADLFVAADGIGSSKYHKEGGWQKWSLCFRDMGHALDFVKRQKKFLEDKANSEEFQALMAQTRR